LRVRAAGRRGSLGKIIPSNPGALDLERAQDRVAVLNAVAGAAVANRARYTGLVLALASEQARAELEVLMVTAHKETLVDRLLAEGRAEGECGRSPEARRRSADLARDPRDVVDNRET
jgi:hypothetical protein